MEALGRLINLGLNHVMAGEPWASERLRKYAGRHVLVDASVFRFQWLIDQEGLFRIADATTPADVTLILPVDTPVRLMLDRDRWFSSVRLAGSVDLAETLGFVFRHLNWDVESDLAKLVGDIAAHRMARAGKALGEALQRSLRGVSENLVEFATHESHFVVQHDQIHDFRLAISGLRDDLARLEKRIERLR